MTIQLSNAMPNLRLTMPPSDSNRRARSATKPSCVRAARIVGTRSFICRHLRGRRGNAGIFHGLVLAPRRTG